MLYDACVVTAFAPECEHQRTADLCIVEDNVCVCMLVNILPDYSLLFLDALQLEMFLILINKNFNQI